MSLAKVIEVIAESETSWDDAAQSAVREAAETLRHVKHLYVKDMQAVVENGRIVKYRLNANITFILETPLD